MIFSGTLAYVKNLTLHHNGKIWFNIEGRTEGQAASNYEFDFVKVKDQGYLHMISDPVIEPNITFTVIGLNIDGGGLVRGTYMYFHALNISIDAGGVLSSDGLGYEMADGYSIDQFGAPVYGLHGIINEGRGHTGSNGGSGAGHGGSGGRASGKHLQNILLCFCIHV